MCLDFTVTEQIGGEPSVVELVEGGSNKEVTNDNLVEYLEALLRYQILERGKPQLTELLLGFLDVVPEPALAVFDSSELELMLCGLQDIDVDDWEVNTQYSGTWKENGKDDDVVKWFWEIVRVDFDCEMRARLLQFVTGTTGVPTRGFVALKGVDGTLKSFSIHGTDLETSAFPRAQ